MKVFTALSERNARGGGPLHLSNQYQTQTFCNKKEEKNAFCLGQIDHK